MIDAIENNLKRGVRLLNAISDAQYSNTSVKPYHSSIGIHMRHILDMFDCIFCGLDSKKINLTERKRNELAEQKTTIGLAYFDEIINKLRSLNNVDLDQIVDVSDDLGLGMVTTKYTLASILTQAHSHAIHHFASIGYIISQLGIELPDADFGYNPTTPKKVENF
ncbi:DinB family protein [Aureibaculum sp. 2210JD6-5]|uniref:DinB family protein n=1 Tax=Aureibaculum sp. 2210JD6-5 TaxID=3103957 RepID=UPI002AAD73ED|nr:DinB family protein [Aureibaculum sp. 2210JD6-5]MDY7393755.1 DinB family protein [Aureibaculum sp. 2210JD6-5]